MGTPRPSAIAFVGLADSARDGEPQEPLAGFFFRRFMRETFRTPITTPPHRHNFQEMIIIQSGHARHAIDGQSVDLTPGTVSLIAQGQVHAFEQATEMEGWLVRFTDDFLPAGFISTVWNYHATLFNRLGHRQTLSLNPDDIDTLGSVLALVEAEWAEYTRFESENALRHLLAILIVRLERIYQQAFKTDRHEPDAYRLYQRFMALLETEVTRHHDVQYYATSLGLPPARLSRILTQIVGKSTKQVIDERIVLDAKRYLHFTNLPIKEIAAILGYGDVFHLSKTFKRLTGVPPHVFREQREK